MFVHLQIKMKAERATEFWRVPPLLKVPATPSSKVPATPSSRVPATPGNKRPPLTIVTPATTKKRTLENPAEFTFNVRESVFENSKH